MHHLILATRNRHKVQEIQDILGVGALCQSLAEWPEPPALVEDQQTFEGNAERKALQVASWFRSLQSDPTRPDSPPTVLIVADDSGLEVDALGGAPGVLSARFAADETRAAGNASDIANNAKLLRMLAPVPWELRTARFRCVLAVTNSAHGTAGSAPDATEFSVRLFSGACEGRIAFEPRGRRGFGYDPLFIPAGLDQSFAELGDAIKNQISHRSAALSRFRAWLELRLRGE